MDEVPRWMTPEERAAFWRDVRDANRQLTRPELAAIRTELDAMIARLPPPLRWYIRLRVWLDSR